MCGITALFNAHYYNQKDIIEFFNNGKPRGPEFTSHKTLINDIFLGFHRLAINGLDEESNQPLIIASKHNVILYVMVKYIIGKNFEIF